MVDIMEMETGKMLVGVNENIKTFNVGDYIIFKGQEYVIHKRVHEIEFSYFLDSHKANSEVWVIKAV